LYIRNTTIKRIGGVVGILDKLGKKRKANPVELPALLAKDANPVNYDSVLDYLVGLSEEDYKKICKVTGIYREANKKAATVLNVEDQPTTSLVEDKLTDEEIDESLDQLLETPADDLKEAIVNQAVADEPKKVQAPSKETKITVND
jgi:hypothetical protein